MSQPDAISDASFLDMMRRMGAVATAPAPTASPTAGRTVPAACYGVVQTAKGRRYHRPDCRTLVGARTVVAPIADAWARGWSLDDVSNPHGAWVIADGRPGWAGWLYPCVTCLRELVGPSTPCPADDRCAACEAAAVERARPARFRGCVVTTTGRKYHRPGCSSFYEYSHVAPVTTLRVQRESPQTGELEWVVLTPCKVCRPPRIDDPDAARGATP